MFRPAAILIGLRYVSAKRRNHFVSLISLISMLGITLGVIVLITILSVLNGFDREIKRQIFSMISPITINSYVGMIDDWQALENNLQQAIPTITAIAPFTNGQALLTNTNTTQAAIVTGILPAQEKNISALANKMIAGKLNDLIPNHFGIVIGEDLANHLHVKLGDELTVATPTANSTATNITPRFKKFSVVGIFRAGGGPFGFDAKFAFVNLADAQALFNLDSAVSGLHINIADLYQAPNIADVIQAQLPGMLRASNWTEQLGDFFENIRVTKTMLFFIFILIIAVAVFNLISTMVMAVKNKVTDIAILRTFGATPKTIMGIFFVQGAVIGIGGVLLGILGGIALAKHISAISIWIQQALHMKLVTSSVYFVDYLPAELQWHDVWVVSGVALLLSLLATLYPAWSAARLQPVDALQRE